MRPLSNDLRKRIIAAVDNQEGSRRQIARRFKVDVSCITRLLQLRRQTGSIAPRPHGGGITPTLDQDGLGQLRRLVEDHPDATLRELRDRLGIGGSIMIVWRGLKSLGITRKKKTEHAEERDRPDVQQEREWFREQAEPIEPGRFVFVDETGVTTAMTPGYGPRPQRGAGRRPGPRFLGIDDGDRGPGPGRSSGPVGDIWFEQRRDLPGLCRAGPGPGAAQGRCRHLR